MCALFGWLDYGKKLPHSQLKKLTQALANAAEERGTDASGISYVKNGRIHIYKKPKPAHKVKFDFPKDTTIIMGHTRLATQGNQKFNFNNHPFYGKADKSFAFAHNGILHNDEELRRSKKLPETYIETDSYVAVQLIENQNKLNFDSLKSMAEDVQGNFTFTVLDEENTLYFIKGNNPLYLIYFEKFELFAYASTESIMVQALEKSGLGKFTYQIIRLKDGDILSISENGKIDMSTFTPVDYDIFNSSIHGFACDCYDYYSEYEEMLYNVCSSFGVSNEDVELLLEFGYEPYEIEEMLIDSDLIKEIVAELKYAY